MKLKLLSIFLLFLNSCAVGPDYHTPNVIMPEKFKEESKNWKEATGQPHED